MHETKCTKMETKLKKIEELSSKDHKLEFNWLIQHFNSENLTCCFQRSWRDPTGESPVLIIVRLK